MATDDLLSQDEIDALLSGVDNGDIETEADGVGQSENVDTFNFSSQDRLVRGRMPALDTINERFARDFNKSVSDLLRRVPTISVEGVQTTKYGEYIQALLMPSHLNVVKVSPLRGSALFVFDPKLVFSLAEAFYGGDGNREAKPDGQDFTVTESRLVRRLLTSLFDNLTQAWQPVLDLSFEYAHTEVNPQFANIVTPSEVVVVCTFNIDLGIGSGDMSIVMPYSMLEPIRELLDGDIKPNSSAKDSRWAARLQDEVKSASITVTTTLARAELSVRDVLNMKKGDVIQINMPDTLIASVKDVPVFRAKYGSSRGNCALKVDEFLNHSLVTPSDMKIGVLEK